VIKSSSLRASWQRGMQAVRLRSPDAGPGTPKLATAYMQYSDRRAIGNDLADLRNGARATASTSSIPA
jgi:hypothetical protein